jgi:hypothetical protein
LSWNSIFSKMWFIVSGIEICISRQNLTENLCRCTLLGSIVLSQSDKQTSMNVAFFANIFLWHGSSLSRFSIPEKTYLNLSIISHLTFNFFYFHRLDIFNSSTRYSNSRARAIRPATVHLNPHRPDGKPSNKYGRFTLGALFIAQYNDEATANAHRFLCSISSANLYRDCALTLPAGLFFL